MVTAFASEKAARQAARKSGIVPEAIEVVETKERIVDPKEGFDLRVYHGTPESTLGNS
jgi:hypothetical protein